MPPHVHTLLGYGMLFITGTVCNNKDKTSVWTASLCMWLTDATQNTGVGSLTSMLNDIMLSDMMFIGQVSTTKYAVAI